MLKTSLPALEVAAALLMLSSCGLLITPEKAPPGAAQTAAADAAIKAVKEANQAREAAIEAGDITGYLAAYLDDAVWMPPHAPEIVGKENAAVRLKQVLDQVSVDQVIQDEEHVMMSTDHVAERGKYAFSVTPKAGGAPRQETGNFMVIWKKDADGKWKIGWEMWTTARPVAELPGK